jgi:protein-disulfide isomerase
VALAAGKQGKYFEMHQALFESKGVSSEESALKIGARLGLDVEKLKQDMGSPEVDKAIEEARALANKLAVQGTPFYLVGDRILPGAPEDLYEQLVAKVAEVRKEGCNASVSC